MKRVRHALLLLAAFCFAAGLSPAQQPQAPASSVVSRSVNAIGYQVGGGGTKVDLKATELMPQARGEAKVEAKQGVAAIEAEIKGLAQPTKLGSEFLTYVLWVVSPDGRTSNLGEILVDNSGEAKIKATTQLQTFSLVVTAEPYFSVRQPSEMVILINAIRKDTKGKIFIVNEYKLIRRGQYEKMGNPLALSLDLKNVPLEMYEARNAVEIAKSRGADKYAPEIFTKAESSLKMAENSLTRKANKKEIVSTARQAVQFSEDARALAVQRQDEERIENERLAAAAKAKTEAEAKAAAEAAEAKRKAEAEAAEAKRKADEEAQRQAELAAARQAQIQSEAAEAKRRADEEARRQAELAAAREAQMKAEAGAAALQAKLEADALRAKEEATAAEAERARQAADEARQAAEALRAQLLEQLNRILDTRDTPRGLVVNMADVLFDTGKYDLKPTTREKLARLSGVMLAHSSLNLDVEGHTDSTGSDELNQTLSEKRAGTVRDYLVEQGLLAANVTAKGFGKSMPVADNETAAGRQQNRRVEIVVSGEVIGAKIGN